MADKKKSRPQFDNDNDAIDTPVDPVYPQQLRLWDESNPNLAPEPGSGRDASYTLGEKGTNIIENNHGPNPIGMNPNKGLPPDDDNVGSPTLSTVYDVNLDRRSHKGKY